MAPDSSTAPTPVDLSAWLDGRRQSILNAIRFHDGKANTLEIREYAKVPRGSFNHHVDLLVDPPEKVRDGLDWLDGGLIEIDGEVEVGMPSPARLFVLTDAGERALSESGLGPGISASDVEDLQDRVEELETENEDLKQRFTQLRDYVEEQTADP